MRSSYNIFKLAQYWIFWNLLPTVEFKVRWPVGNIVVNDQDPRWVDLGGAVWVDLGISADPNDHYRPWLEKHIGKQGWAWDWNMIENDVAANQLTLKVRQDKAEYAIIAVMRWA